MTQTHTPGPWIVARGDSVYARRGDGPLAPIADCNASRTVTAANRAANAVLIAAAPDLLAALRAFNAWYMATDLPWNFDISQTVLDGIDAAIAKAEGRS